MKKIFFAFLLIGILNSSCDNFLEEEFLSGENSSTIVQSEQGIESLISAAYVSLRAWYGKENGWDLTESGTDIYTRGLDNRAYGFCTYSSLVGEEQNRMAAMWYELYSALNTCNLALKYIDETPFASETKKTARKAEVTFLRAHYLWQIVETWGGVQLSLEPTNAPIRTAHRSPISKFYEQIFVDLEAAEAIAPETTGEYGRITKPIVQAFLARTHLMWASYCKNGLSIRGEVYIEQNNPLAQTHYKKALDYAKLIIANGSNKLISDWSKIWSIDNIKNDEIVWAVNYSDDAVYTRTNLRDPWADNYPAAQYNTTRLIQRDGGNQAHVMYEIRYENLAYGVVRDLRNGRGFQRWMPTKYFINLYNEKYDQRFYGSFKNVWYANSETTIPKWKPIMLVDGQKISVPKELWAKPMFKVGDTAIVFYKKPVPKSQKAKYADKDLFYFHPVKGYLMIDINDMYLADGKPNDAIINRQFYFPITKRYNDSTRLDLTTQYSKRDAYVIRISEVYLIAAEASLELNKWGESYDYLLALANARAYNGNGELLLATYGVGSADDLTLDFILDERGRELATEFQRFFDLKRTGKLVERIQAFNPDAAANIQDFHALRFIPQEQLDAITNKDEFKQNPGY